MSERRNGTSLGPDHPMTAGAPQAGDGETCIPIGDHAHARVSPGAPPELLGALGRLADAARRDFSGRPDCTRCDGTGEEPDPEPCDERTYPCQRCNGAGDEPPVEAQQDGPCLGCGNLHVCVCSTPWPAARPSADTETLRRVRELANESEARHKRYATPLFDGSTFPATVTVTDLRAALDGGLNP